MSEEGGLVLPQIVSGQCPLLLRLLQFSWEKFHRMFGLWRLISTLAHWFPSWQRLPIIGPDREKFLIDLRDPCCINIMVRGFAEQGEMRVVAGFLNQMDVVLDIGANVGIWTRYLGSLVPNGRVYAFEPSNATFELLLSNCQGATNLHAYHMAISNVSGETRLSDDWASDFRHLGDNGQPVRATTVDDWIAMNGIERLDFVKLDIEGAEHKALQGANKSLQRFMPVLLFEHIPENAARFGFENRNQTIQLLEEMGYRVRRVMQSGELSEDLEPRGAVTSNYLAVGHPKLRG